MQKERQYTHSGHTKGWFISLDLEEVNLKMLE